jgi:hypothetical protein
MYGQQVFQQCHWLLALDKALPTGTILVHIALDMSLQKAYCFTISGALSRHGGCLHDCLGDRALHPYPWACDDWHNEMTFKQEHVVAVVVAL